MTHRSSTSPWKSLQDPVLKLVVTAGVQDVTRPLLKDSRDSVERNAYGPIEI